MVVVSYLFTLKKYRQKKYSVVSGFVEKQIQNIAIIGITDTSPSGLIINPSWVENGIVCMRKRTALVLAKRRIITSLAKCQNTIMYIRYNLHICKRCDDIRRFLIVNNDHSGHLSCLAIIPHLSISLHCWTCKYCIGICHMAAMICHLVT